MDELLEDFTAHINAIHPAIRFTREEEEAGVIAVLDAKITRKEDRLLLFSVYRKPTHTDHYLQFGSNHLLQHKLGVIRTLVHRSSTICSNRDEQALEIQHLKRVLSEKGMEDSHESTSTERLTKHAAFGESQEGECHHPLCWTGYWGDCPPPWQGRDYSHPPIQHHKGDPGPTKGETLNGGAMWSGVPDHLHQLPSRLCSWDREATSQATEGAPAPWFPSKWPHSGTQPQLHQGGCSSVKHREKDWFRWGVAESIYIAEGRPSLNLDRGRHSLPPNLQTAVVVVTLVTCIITGSYVTTTRKPQFSEEDPWSQGRKLKISPDVRWC